VYTFTPTTLTTLFVKTTTAQTSFQKVGNTLYMVDGVDTNKWDGTINFASYSQVFDNAVWAPTAGVTVTANATTDPLGGNTADEINFASKGTNSVDGITQNVTIPSGTIVGQTFTFSLWLKSTSGSPTVEVIINPNPYYDETGGSITATLSTSWQRFSVTMTVLAGVADNTIQLQIRAPYATSGSAYSVYAWGAQLEYGASPTTYQSTTSAYPVSGIGISAPVTAPTLSFGSGPLSPTVGYQYGYTYRNGRTGGVGVGTTSTLSPLSASTLAQTSKDITVAGADSSDPQVNEVDIYRNDDGGVFWYYLATVANVVGGGGWTYTDSTADIGLNNDIVAPMAHSNDPIPTGASLLVYHMGRLWTAAANQVYFAGGPDITNGNGNEAWPPANVFTFPGKVTAFASTTAGLLAFTSDDIFIIYGTSLATFYDATYQKLMGVQSQNCVAQDGDSLFIYTSTSQLYLFDAGTLSEPGFAIGDQLLAHFNPATSYLALYKNGSDAGLFISDGSTNMYKYRLDQSSWSTVAQVVGGAGAISTVETSTAVYTLLTGRTAGSGYILGRSVSTWQDSGSSYACNGIIGTLVLAPPGETTKLDSVLIERMPTGSDAVVSVLLNEISGAATALPNPIPDPPLLVASTTIIARRHWLKAAAVPLPQFIRHLQVTVAFPTENAKNELLSLCLG
jgi:hypothetical protein